MKSIYAQAFMYRQYCQKCPHLEKTEDIFSEVYRCKSPRTTIAEYGEDIVKDSNGMVRSFEMPESCPYRLEATMQFQRDVQ